MKKLITITGILLVAAAIPGGRACGQAGVAGIIQAGIKKAIQAVDLKIQRLQNKTVWLQDAQKTMENTLSEWKLGEIAGWVEKQRVLYQEYFDELTQVKDVISYYHRVREIITRQMQLVSACRKAYALSRTDPHFTGAETEYMAKVYAGILDESAVHLDQLFSIIRSFSWQMGDAQRLEFIRECSDGIEKNYFDMARFSQQNILLSMQRSKDGYDLAGVKALYGLP